MFRTHKALQLLPSLFPILEPEIAELSLGHGHSFTYLLVHQFLHDRFESSLQEQFLLVLGASVGAVASKGEFTATVVGVLTREKCLKPVVVVRFDLLRTPTTCTGGY